MLVQGREGADGILTGAGAWESRVEHAGSAWIAQVSNMSVIPGANPLTVVVYASSRVDTLSSIASNAVIARRIQERDALETKLHVLVALSILVERC